MLAQVSNLYSGACDMFVRPPRRDYVIEELGPPIFKLGTKEFVREDIKLENSRGLTLECSHTYSISHRDNSTLLTINDQSTKQLKTLSEEKGIDISDCVEKREIKEMIIDSLTLSDSEAPGPCILYLHGNAGCRLDSLDAYYLSLLYGFSLFAVDLSGSGKSGGEFISLGFYEKLDVHTIVKYLKEVDFVTDIILWGRSMGAATSILYSSEYKEDISGMILDSPFSDLYSLSREIVEKMDVAVPSFLISSIFPVAMQFVKRSVRQKANFDLYEVSPVSVVDKCEMPCFFVHGNHDTFVKPSHCLELYEKYGGKKKEIILVDGTHNDARPFTAFDSISVFIHRFLLPPHMKVNYPEPLSIFGNTKLTKTRDCFNCKQVRGIDKKSQFPYMVVLGVGEDSIDLIEPYSEVLINSFPFEKIKHVTMRDENVFMMVVPGHIDYDTDHINHYDGVLAFHCIGATGIYYSIVKRANSVKQAKEIKNSDPIVV